VGEGGASPRKVRKPKSARGIGRRGNGALVKAAAPQCRPGTALTNSSRHKKANPFVADVVNYKARPAMAQ